MSITWHQSLTWVRAGLRPWVSTHLAVLEELRRSRHLLPTPLLLLNQSHLVVGSPLLQFELASRYWVSEHSQVYEQKSDQVFPELENQTPRLFPKISPTFVWLNHPQLAPSLLSK